MKNILELTSQQLRRAAQIKEQIASLERQMQNLLGQAAPSGNGNGGMSPAARAKISAAAKERWAKIKGAKPRQASAKPAPSTFARKPMSAAQKAKIAATLKARWAKIKGSKQGGVPTKQVQKSAARKPMSAAQKAKIAETLKARWAKIKAAKK